jgi:hypothetical protein
MKLETIPIESLKPHPDNYNDHPEDQLAHLIKSIKNNGIYRPLVIAKDNVILAGHGVYTACQKMGIKEIPVYRVAIESNDPRALKIVVGDNEISHLSEKDDYKLTKLLKEIMDFDKNMEKEVDALLGTGYDDKMLSNLVFVTRPQTEIKDKNAAAEWIGMPEYVPGSNPLKVVVNFEKEEEKIGFFKKLGIKVEPKTKSIWWPPRKIEDPSSLKFKADAK